MSDQRSNRPGRGEKSVRSEKRNDFRTVRPDRPPRPYASKPELRGNKTPNPPAREGGSGEARSNPAENRRPGGYDGHKPAFHGPRSGNSAPRRDENKPWRGDRPAKPAGDRPERGDKPAFDRAKPSFRGNISGKYGKPAFSRGNAVQNKGRFTGESGKAPRPGATDGMPARRIALEVIRRTTENGAYASLALDEKLRGCTLSGADRRFAARLVYDTLDNLRYLDWALAKVMAKPDTDIRLVNVLRLGACQLLLDYRVPENAATDTSVRLCKEIGLEGLAGVCNGILRNLIRAKEELRLPEDMPDLERLALETSVPAWLAAKLADDWGGETAARLLRWKNRDAGLTLRPNLTRLTDEKFEALLAEKVWTHEPGRLPHAVRIHGMQDITADADWRAGLFSIQSEGSMAACMAVDPQRGWRVLDACAAPGGKACYLAELMQDTGRVQAWELHPHRTELVEAQRKRLGLENVRPMTRDATVRREDLDGTMDAVLLDAPCSGTGDMAEKPDIKLRLTEEKLGELCATQAELLDNVSLAVRPGGVLVYATCSLLRDENDRQVEAFLKRHPDFSLDPLPASLPDDLRAQAEGQTGLQLFPHRDGIGGFYLCRMRRAGR